MVKRVAWAFPVSVVLQVCLVKLVVEVLPVVSAQWVRTVHQVHTGLQVLSVIQVHKVNPV
jgi:hypothetical protein